MSQDPETPPPDEVATQHASNFNLKWTMFSFKNLDVAVAWSFMNFHTQYGTPLVLPSGTFSRGNIELTWSTLVMNYYFENLPMALGYNVSSVFLSSDNKDVDDILRKQNTGSEYVWDLNYIFDSTWSVTGSVGKVKVSAFELEKAYMSFGGSVTYVRHKKWFNEISLGIHHFNEINTERFLFSFSI